MQRPDFPDARATRGRPALLGRTSLQRPPRQGPSRSRLLSYTTQAASQRATDERRGGSQPSSPQTRLSASASVSTSWRGQLDMRRCCVSGAPVGAGGALDAELRGLRPSQLSQKAAALGVDAARIEEAEDAEDACAALIALVLATSEAEDPEREAIAAARAELGGMKLSELKRRGRAAGVSKADLDEAGDGDAPKLSIVELILARRPAQDAAPPAAAAARVRAELEGMKPSQLRKRAAAEGVGEDAVEEAEDTDDPIESMIHLICDASSGTGLGDRPHFGTAKQQQAQRSKPKAAPRKGLLPANKHAMISYQWDDQERVIAARKTLTKLGVPCWMDIDGGMKQDIYESMAEGAMNAACVVCYMSQKYQDSVSTQAPSHHSLTSRGCF